MIVRMSSPSILLEHFKLRREDLYQVNGPVNLARLLAVYDLVDRRDLKYPPFTPGVPEQLVKTTNLFEVVGKKRYPPPSPLRILHADHGFLVPGAFDPDVVAIKQTLYRTGPDSPLVDSLVQSCQGG